MVKKFYTSVGAALIVFALIMLAETFLSPFAPSVRDAAAIMPPDLTAVNALYGTLPPAPAMPSAHASTYIPRYEPTDRRQADAIAEPFAPREASETDDEFLYICENGLLTISKHFNHIVYRTENMATAPPVRAGGTPSEQAAAFLTSYALPVPYGLAETEEAEDSCTIRLYPRLGGTDCLAFPAIVSLSPDGALLTLEVYSFAFDRLSGCKLLPFSAACAALPLDFPEDTRITLERVAFVYTLKDSILQPGYLVEGVYADGELFRCILPAAVFAQ